MARILFAEAHRGFRQSASYLMDLEPDLEVVAQAGSVTEGRERMAEGRIDVAVVDVPLPDDHGLGLIRGLRGVNPAVPILVLTRAQDRDGRGALLEAGASGVLSLSEGAGFAGLLAAVRRLAEARAGVLRVLVAYEETHAAYRGALVGALRELRPRAAVTAASLGALASEVERLDPHLVVCSRPNEVDPGGRAAWVTLAPEPGDPSGVCLDGEHSASENPGLEELLAVLDGAEKLLRDGREPGGC